MKTCIWQCGQANGKFNRTVFLQTSIVLSFPQLGQRKKWESICLIVIAQLLCIALSWRAFGTPWLEADNRAHCAFVCFALFLTKFVEGVTNTRNYFSFCEHCEYLLFWINFPATTEMAAISRPVTQYDAMFICIKTMVTAIQASNIVIARRRREFSRYSSRLKWSSGWFTGDRKSVV